MGVPRNHVGERCMQSMVGSSSLMNVVGDGEAAMGIMQALPRRYRRRGVLARGVALVWVEKGCPGCLLVLLLVVVQGIVVRKLWSRCWFAV